MARFDLYKAINDVVGIVAYGNIRQNTIKSYIEQDVPKLILSDMNRMQQILLNLLTNANKFSKEGKIKVFCKYKKEYS